MIDYSGVDTEFLAGRENIMVLKACSGESFFVVVLGCWFFLKDR